MKSSNLATDDQKYLIETHQFTITWYTDDTGIISDNENDLIL